MYRSYPPRCASLEKTIDGPPTSCSCNNSMISRSFLENSQKKLSGLTVEKANFSGGGSEFNVLYLEIRMYVGEYPHNLSLCCTPKYFTALRLFYNYLSYK